MSTDSPTLGTGPQEATLQKVRSLGSSPLGEAFEVLRLRPLEGDPDQTDQEIQRDHLVLKRIHRGRLKSPEKFRQRFEALTRLQEPHLVTYRELYLGEQALRILRDFVEGIPLNHYLNRPITAEESEELQRSGDALPEDLTLQDEVPEAPATPVSSPSSPSAASTTEATNSTADGEGDVPLSLINPEESDRPTTLEIPSSLLEDSDAVDRALDLIILRLRRILPQILDALEYLHRFRQVHGALKPSNILVTESHLVRIKDFGLYPEIELTEDSNLGFTSYSAPETSLGIYTAESDLYSLGAMLFEALADHPFGLNEGGSPQYLSEILPHCPASWADLIHGLLSTDPADRPGLAQVAQLVETSEKRSVTIRASVVENPETLHGRRDHFNEIVEAAKEVSQLRHMSLALVEGEPGVGKTSLLDALTRWAAQHGWIILRGRFYADQPVVYQGLDSVVERLAPLLGDLPEKTRRRLARDRARAGRVFPRLLLDEPPPTHITRRAALASFRALLEHLSEERPIFIGLDDLHLAGPDSRELLIDLAESPRGLRVFLIGTSLPEPSTPSQPLWPVLRDFPAPVDRVRLDRFSPMEAQEYLLAHGAHLTLPQKQEILSHARENPLLIDEMIHEAQRESDGEALVVSDTADPLACFLDRRTAHLSRTERLTLQLLAVAQTPLPASVIEQALRRDLGAQRIEAGRGLQILTSLVSQRLAKPLHRSHDQSFEVIHDSCRQVIEAEISRDHLAHLYGLIADSLDETTHRDLRFDFLRRAGRDEEAARSAVELASIASDRFAYHRAADLLDWLDARDHLPDHLQVRRAESLRAAGQHGAAAAVLEPLTASADLQIRRRARRDMVLTHLGGGDREAATAALAEALSQEGCSLHKPSLSERLRLRRLALRATLGRWSDVVASAQQDAAIHPAQEDLLLLGLNTAPFLSSSAIPRIQTLFASRAHTLRAPELLAQDRLHMVGLPWQPFLVRSGLGLDRWIEQANTLFKDREHTIGAGRVAETTALLLCHRGDYAGALEAARQGLQALHHWGGPQTLIDTRLTALTADLEFHCGDLATAARSLDRLAHRIRHHRWLHTFHALHRVDLHLWQGEITEARRKLSEIEEFLDHQPDSWLHLWWMHRRTRLHLALGQPRVATAEWDLHIQRYPQALRKMPRARLLIQQGLAMALCAEAREQRSMEDPREHVSLRRLRQTLRRLGDLRAWMGYADAALLTRLQAHMELLRGRPHRALRALAEGPTLDPAAQPVLHALFQEVRARIRIRMEEPEARRLLQGARQDQADLGLDLPLVLEGWSVPSERARLQHDESRE